ncbi:hypothetical protein ACFFV7_45910 [Nonomuraea spiralis]|uniref:DUF3168 domain-containing protein n=1 Tax=Nonomuraea spiralis TaxID=46182 RepID=A0ABV5IX85_9ACTN|nr:hypothetical protein [Nonomuraea spiralis]
MRTAFAHEATIVMEDDSDVRALGAAITVALCGHWDHEPPCPVAPHHTAADRRDGVVLVRVLFAAEPDAEDEVRSRIDTALARGTLKGPDGVTSRWRLLDTRPGRPRAEELPHAEQLLRA